MLSSLIAVESIVVEVPAYATRHENKINKMSGFQNKLTGQKGMGHLDTVS